MMDPQIVELFRAMNEAGVPAWMVFIFVVLRWVGRKVTDFQTTIITEMRGVKEQLGEHVKTTERRLNLIEMREELRRHWPDIIKPPDPPA